MWNRIGRGNTIHAGHFQDRTEKLTEENLLKSEHGEGPWMPQEGGNAQIRWRKVGRWRAWSPGDWLKDLQKFRGGVKLWDQGNSAQDREERLEESGIFGHIPLGSQTQPGLLRNGPRCCHPGHIYHPGWLIKLYWSHLFCNKKSLCWEKCHIGCVWGEGTIELPAWFNWKLLCQDQSFLYSVISRGGALLGYNSLPY